MYKVSTTINGHEITRRTESVTPLNRQGSLSLAANSSVYYTWLTGIPTILLSPHHKWLGNVGNMLSLSNG